MMRMAAGDIARWPMKGRNHDRRPPRKAGRKGKPMIDKTDEAIKVVMGATLNELGRLQCDGVVFLVCTNSGAVIGGSFESHTVCIGMLEMEKERLLCEIGYDHLQAIKKQHEQPAADSENEEKVAAK